MGCVSPLTFLPPAIELLGVSGTSSSWGPDVLMVTQSQSQRTEGSTSINPNQCPRLNSFFIHHRTRAKMGVAPSILALYRPPQTALAYSQLPAEMHILECAHSSL